MAYIKQNWVDDVSDVNAERMNHIEEGIAGALPKSDYAYLDEANEAFCMKNAEIRGILHAINLVGRNLLLNCMKYSKNNHYPTATYYFGYELPVEGEFYTIRLRGQLAEGKTSFGIYNSGSSIQVVNLYPSDQLNGVYQKTFQWKNSDGSTTVDNTHIRIYPMPGSAPGESIIEWVKLERGKGATLLSLAPEELKETGLLGKTIQTGRVGVPVAVANTTGSVDITFPKAFSRPPNVFLSANTALPERLFGPTATAITATGFTIKVRCSAVDTTSTDWLAIGDV